MIGFSELISKLATLLSTLGSTDNELGLTLYDLFIFCLYFTLVS